MRDPGVRKSSQEEVQGVQKQRRRAALFSENAFVAENSRK